MASDASDAVVVPEEEAGSQVTLVTKWDWTKVTLGGMASLAILLGAWMVASTGDAGNAEAGFVLIVLGALLLGAWLVDRIHSTYKDDAIKNED